MNRPEACLFDLDGVLLDTEQLHSETWSRTARIYGTDLSQQQLMNLQGRRRLECAGLLVKWVKKTISVKELLKIHQPIYKELMNDIKPVSGAEELVTWCSNNNLAMALVTSSNAKSVAMKSSSHDWLKLIEARVYGDDSNLRKGKPAPEPFLLAANKLGVNPKNCWAIEDSDSGKESAINAGCHVWLLNSKYIKNKETNHLDNPTYISHLNQILEKLKD